jgi:hypothetical protein
MIMATTDVQDYTLGRAEIHFAPFKDGTQDPDGFRWLGNVTQFNMTFSADKLDHFASYRGVKEKDSSVNLQTNRTGSFITDNTSPENIALFFFGSASALTISQATITDEAIPDVHLGRSYQLGVSPSNPSGARAIIFPGTSGTTFALKKASTTFTSGIDYTLDKDSGFIDILPTGSIVEGDDLTCTYTVSASTRKRIISGSSSVNGAMKVISRNPVGTQKDYMLPWVSLSPNGDYGLISDEWQTIPFSFEVLKRTDREALYVDTRS